MVEKFPNLIEATAYRDRMRAEGFHAEIINEASSSIWGGSLVRSVRVQVSEEPLDPELAEHLPDLGGQETGGEKESPFKHFFHKALVGFLALVLGVVAVMLVVGAIANPSSALVLLAKFLGAALIVLLGGTLIARSATFLRPDDPEDDENR